ncbi:MAG TPA: acylphosphatase [Gemmatimonadales bacterium]|nr:acylphosphatase [Gemmatimonadales bacterium]
MRYVVAGRVQGVGFRWFVLREAQRLRLKGYASNLLDGTVEVVASGEAVALERLEAALSRGPSGAIVSGVDKSIISHEVTLPNPFDIK